MQRPLQCMRDRELRLTQRETIESIGREQTSRRTRPPQGGISLDAIVMLTLCQVRYAMPYYYRITVPLAGFLQRPGVQGASQMSVRAVYVRSVQPYVNRFRFLENANEMVPRVPSTDEKSSKGREHGG